MIAALTEHDVRQLLLMDIGETRHGVYCLVHDINPVQLSQFLNGHRGPNPAVLKALRLKPVMLYVSEKMKI